MKRLNILNKQGMLTDEDRKEQLHHNCYYISFESCLDLSEPVKMTLFGTIGKITLENYTRDIATFMCFFQREIMKDLNGFSGFSHVRFIPTNFKIV